MVEPEASAALADDAFRSMHRYNGDGHTPRTYHQSSLLFLRASAYDANLPTLDTSSADPHEDEVAVDAEKGEVRHRALVEGLQQSKMLARAFHDTFLSENFEYFGNAEITPFSFSIPPSLMQTQRESYLDPWNFNDVLIAAHVDSEGGENKKPPQSIFRDGTNFALEGTAEEYISAVWAKSVETRSALEEDEKTPEGDVYRPENETRKWESSLRAHPHFGSLKFARGSDKPNERVLEVLYHENRPQSVISGIWISKKW